MKDAHQEVESRLVVDSHRAAVENCRLKVFLILKFVRSVSEFEVLLDGILMVISQLVKVIKKEVVEPNPL